MANTNRDIDNLLLHGEFFIEQNFGMEVLAQYLHELELIRQGVNYADLGISERRHEKKTAIFIRHSDGEYITAASSNLADSGLPPGSIAHLRLEGLMRSRDSLSTPGIGTLVSQISLANANPRIAGILIEANTGGGEATAATILHSALVDNPKPVVVLAHFLASGGVLGTLSAKEVIASSSTAKIGSIGTMMTLDKGFRQWFNENYQEVYATNSKNKNGDFRKYLSGDMSGIVKNLDDFNDAFTQEVKNYRPLRGNEQYVSHTLSGAMFQAREARRRGLVDGIGGMQYALKRLRSYTVQS